MEVDGGADSGDGGGEVWGGPDDGVLLRGQEASEMDARGAGEGGCLPVSRHASSRGLCGFDSLSRSLPWLALARLVGRSVLGDDKS